MVVRSSKRWNMKKMPDPVVAYQKEAGNRGGNCPIKMDRGQNPNRVEFSVANIFEGSILYY